MLSLTTHLIFPLEFGPHCSEFCFGARSWHDVIHDVDVNIVEDDDVTIGGCTGTVVNDVAENDAVFGGCNFHVGFDAIKNYVA